MTAKRKSSYMVKPGPREALKAVRPNVDQLSDDQVHAIWRSMEPAARDAAIDRAQAQRASGEATESQASPDDAGDQNQS